MYRLQDVSATLCIQPTVVLQSWVFIADPMAVSLTLQESPTWHRHRVAPRTTLYAG